MNAATFFHPPMPVEPAFDVSIDATSEWREVADDDECADTCEALLASDWVEESIGSDDCGDWIEVFDLIGLRVTTPNGATLFLPRPAALDHIGPVAVAALEREAMERNFE